MYRVGEILSISNGLYRHYMIVVGDDRVVHASKEMKIVVEESLEDACQDKQITNHGRKSYLSDAELIWRARNEIGRPYSLLDLNCEHVIRRISGLKVTSPQIVIAVTAFVVGLGMFWLVRKRAT